MSKEIRGWGVKGPDGELMTIRVYVGEDQAWTVARAKLTMDHHPDAKSVEGVHGTEAGKVLAGLGYRAVRVVLREEE